MWFDNSFKRSARSVDREPSSPPPDRNVSLEGDAAPRPASLRRVSQARRLAVLALGLTAAMYLGARSPKEQHVRLMLGDAAPQVTQLEVRYVREADEVVRQARFSFAPGQAPRVVAHEPSLPDGDYRIVVDIDLTEGHREIERRVTLSSGSTQLELGASLHAPVRHGDDAP
jgi:hypothetical protein